MVPKLYRADELFCATMTVEQALRAVIVQDLNTLRTINQASDGDGSNLTVSIRFTAEIPMGVAKKILDNFKKSPEYLSTLGV